MKNQKQKGIALIIASAFSFASMSAFVNLAGALPFWQKLVFRNGFTLLTAVLVVVRHHTPIRISKPDRFPVFGRFVVGTIAAFCNYYAIDHLPLATSNALNKLGPFFAMVFAAIFLRERFSRYQLLCVGVALAGTMFLVVPYLDSLGFPMMVAILGGVCTGGVHVFLRVLRSRGEMDNSAIVFWFALLSLIVTLGPSLAQWQPVTGRQLLCLVGVGMSAAAAQFALTAAYRYASPKDISIYDCTQIIFSGLFGLVLFHQIPSAFSLTAYALIILASALLFFYYRRMDQADAG